MGRSLRVKSELLEQVKKAVGRNGFSQISLAEELTISRATVSKFFNGKAVDRNIAMEICNALGLDLGEVTGYAQTNREFKQRVDWGEATDNTDLSAREEELNALEEKIVVNTCRLVLIEGMKGMGKTNLSYRLGKRIQDHFDFVIWRSLDQYDYYEELQVDLLSFFGGEQSENDEKKWQDLISYLKNYRCLLVFANIDKFLQDYSLNYQNLGCQRLLRWMVEGQKRSCLVMTSSIEPREIKLLKGSQFVHCLQVQPLSIDAIRNIFRNIGSFVGSEGDWLQLQQNYSGNPFVLANIACNVQESFGGNITDFIGYGTVIFNGVEEFLDHQLGYLSEIEKNVMYWLAIYRHSINIFDLKDIVSGLFGDQLLTIISHLKLRFFVEGAGEGILIQPPMIREYFIKRLINEICQEIIKNKLLLLMQFPLLITTTKSLVRKDQEKFILIFIIAGLKRELGTDRHIESRLRDILQQQRGQSKGYICGNILNLLNQLKVNFNEQDFSNLILKNTNFREVSLHGTSLSNSDLSDSIFLHAFSNVLSVTFSHDGHFLAIGDTNDQIYIWKIAGNRLILEHIFTSHNHWVRVLAFSPDSRMIASAGEDGKVYLREVDTGKDPASFDGHIDRVRSLAFSTDGKYLASGSDDKTVRVWNLPRKEFITALTNHKDKVRSVVFHPNSNILISASQDNHICVWEIHNQSVRLLRSFELSENDGNILRTLTISPDGKTLASGSDDGVVRLWNLETGAFTRSFEQRHTNWLRSIVFSPNGDKLASASEDETICVWDVNTSECLHTLKGHTGRVWSVSFHPYRSWLVSGDDGLKVKFWHTGTGECLGAFKGYSQETRPIVFCPDGTILATGNNHATVNLKDSLTGNIQSKLQNDGRNIWSLAYSPDGHKLVGGSDDTKIRIWDLSLKNNPPNVLTGHSNWVRTVAFSPDGQFIASGSDDKTVKLWDANSRRQDCLYTFEAHTDWVRSIFFDPKQPILASGSDDGTIRLWDIKSFNSKPITKLEGNQHQIWTISIHPNGNLLASGSNDNTINVWDLKGYQPLITLKEHRSWVSSLAFSPNGKWLASGSYDMTIRLWELSSGKYTCERILQGHGKAVISIAFHPKKPILASSSKDGSIRLWNLETGEHIDCWRLPRPYENMNITGVTGLTSAQKLSLKTLGAVD
jgi:WD40 repeat protein/transcriptional regulator with XRE-family HTH domain